MQSYKIFRSICLFALLFLPAAVWAQSAVASQAGASQAGASQAASLSGTVTAEGGPLPGAAVWLEGTEWGTSTDADGKFSLQRIAPGSYRLRISAVGWRPYDEPVSLSAGQSLQLDAALREDVLGLQELVVTGTMQETYLAASPVKVEVVNPRYLEKIAAPTSMVEAIRMVNGVQEVTACGVCFTNSISINGLPGAYTAVLLDGAPVYGSLAAVYGLNGIPTTIVERFEVVKGPSSTLYGSEAVAGVINVITKNPKNQPRFALDLMGTSHAESFGSLSAAGKVGRFHTLAGLNYGYINDFDDENGDGFGDNPNLDRLSFFTKWDMERRSGKRFSMAGKLYYEDRRNGVEGFLDDRAYRRLRGSAEVYGESIYTRRAELFGSYELPTAENFRLDYSLSWHGQDSYYGDGHYVAKQGIGFLNALWSRQAGKHSLLGGATLRYNYYDDNTVATEAGDDRQFIPGLFLQDEWKASERVSVLAGARLDHYEAHGPIFSPRLSLKAKAGPWTTLRLNAGTGFRLVNLFTEDHAFVSGNRAVVIAEELKPESSYNISMNINHIYILGEGEGVVDVDAFYTYFTNAIFPNYDDPARIVYANAAGHAVTRGVGASVNHRFKWGLGVNVGLTLMETAEQGEGGRGTLPFAPAWSGVGAADWRWKRLGLSVAYTLRATGPMGLPEVYDLDASGQPEAQARPTRSEAFAIHNVQLVKDLRGTRLQLYGGVQNLLDRRQGYSPLVGYNDPNAPAGFSSYFDTSYAYAPIHGREFYVGVRYAWE